MMKNLSLLLGCFMASMLLADSKILFRNLPGAVQAAAKTEANGARIVGASKEVEKGQTTYEVETIVDGKTRDLSFNSAGNLLAVEQEVSVESIPVQAGAAIRERAAGGSIRKIESVKQGAVMFYEADIVTKSGTRIEVSVNADGSPHRE